MGEWTRIFTDTIDNRPVEGMEFSEGGLRVKTTQKDDFDGEAEWVDNSNFIAVPPMPAGTIIEIEADTKEELKRELINSDFSPEQAQEICDKFVS